MRAAILTDKQWAFLHRYAIGHNTTLDELARHLISAQPKRCASGGNLDRKFEKDRARCAAAIGILERFLDGDDHRACAHDAKHAGQCREANHAELCRLQRAYDDPALLWPIYRRADKGAGYTSTTAAVPARRKAA